MLTKSPDGGQSPGLVLPIAEGGLPSLATDEQAAQARRRLVSGAGGGAAAQPGAAADRRPPREAGSCPAVPPTPSPAVARRLRAARQMRCRPSSSRPAAGSAAGPAVRSSWRRFPPEQAAALQAATDRARVALGLDALAVGRLGQWEERLDRCQRAGTRRHSRGWTAPRRSRSPASPRRSPPRSSCSWSARGGSRCATKSRTCCPTCRCRRGVKVAHLLRHTSGIADLLIPLRDRLNKNLERVWQPEEVVAAVAITLVRAGRRLRLLEHQLRAAGDDRRADHRAADSAWCCTNGCWRRSS